MSDSTVQWAGALNPRKKGELLDLAGQLGLEVEEDEITKVALLDLLKSYLASNEKTFGDDPRFKGLYSRKNPRKDSAPPVEEDEAPHAAVIPPVPRYNPGKYVLREVTPPATPAPTVPSQSLSPIRNALPQTPAQVISNALTRIAPQVEGVVANVSHKAGELSVEKDRVVDITRKYLSSAPTIANLLFVWQSLVLLYTYIPWSYKELSFTLPGTDSANTLAIPYPPQHTLLSSDVYLLLLQLSFQTWFLPLLAGNLVSFNGQSNVADPVSSGIVRLAAAVSSNFGVSEDLLTSKTRVVSAATALAFAVAEVISGRAAAKPSASSGAVANRFSPPQTRSQIAGTPARKAITSS